VAEPEVFDPRRPWSAYLIFGDGLHVCFAEQINRQVMPALLKPLLACEGFTREDKLHKRVFTPDQLWVKFKPPPASALLERGLAQPQPSPA
jgi:cytochrome P450